MSGTFEDVVITGFGAVGAAGVESALGAALLDGRSALHPWEGEGTGLPGAAAGQLRWDRKELRTLPGGKGMRPGTMTWHTVLATAAAGRALADAGLPTPETDPDTCAERRAVSFGSMTNFPELDKHIRLTHTMAAEGAARNGAYVIDDARVMAGMKGFTGFDFLKLMNNMPTAHTVLMANARGPANTFLGGASAMVAMARAVDTIRVGLADQVVTGGTGPGAAEGFVLARHARGEIGLTAGAEVVEFPPAAAAVPGDGAGAFLFERRTAAEGRGARIRAVVHAAEDGFGPPATERGAAPAATVEALVRGVVTAAGGPDGVDLVLLSASGDEEIDAVERAVFSSVFGGGSSRPALALTGAVGGYCEAAQGAIGLAAALLCFEAGRVPNLPPLTGAWRSFVAGLSDPRSDKPRRAAVLTVARGGTFGVVVVDAA